MKATIRTNQQYWPQWTCILFCHQILLSLI